MGLVIRGYVLEPPRVSQSNSPFSFTPNVFISDQGLFDAAYPSSEANPRTEYHVFILEDGDLHEATFCWTKNEVIARFDYEGGAQRFKVLPGATPALVGTLTADSNTTRLTASPPASTNTGAYPIRMSVGVGSGTPFAVSLVANSGAFGSPAPGTVELALDTGELNWNAADLTNFAGQIVRFQRQAFYSFKESTGNIGLIEDALLLNPKPATGQFPLIRIGYGFYLTPVQRATEGSFSVDPVSGTVEWALDSGRLRFNSSDAATYAGKSVFYDGVALAFRLSISPISLGTVDSPGTLVPVPSEDSDVYFRVPGVVQFQEVVFVDSFSDFGKLGVVEINRNTGGVQFSLFDRAAYGGQSLQVVVPDLPIERGMSARWFRTPIDLTSTDPTLKDVSSLYPVVDASLADPIIASPQINLPTRPVESMSITVKIEQGTGTFTGVLANLDVPSPPLGLGYVIDFEKQQLSFARRREDIVIPGSARKPYGAVQLPDPLVFRSNLVLELETTPNSGTFSALTLNTDVTMDYAAGVAKLVDTVGEILAEASAASSVGSILTDTSVDFVAAGVAPGDFLIVPAGSAEGVYTVTAVGTTTLTVDAPLGTLPSLQYTVRHGKEVLADRFFKEVPPVDPNTRVERLNLLGPASNSPRLVIPTDRIALSRVRFGKTSFADLTAVANDAAFTPPGSLAAGTVEVSSDTGSLNFATADLGTDIYWARELVLGTDFRLQAPLGFIEFTERMLEKEEVHLTYAVIGENDEKEIVEERGTFLVRKEVTADHPVPTTTLSFNPLGRELATTPPAAVNRGGRPQRTGVTVDYTASTVTFTGAATATNALPSGETIGPTERVYIDYYIHEALGGEKDVTVLRPPMLGVLIVIEDGTTSFKIGGDRRDEFPSGHLLRVDNTEVYLLAAPSYDAVADLTTVNIAPPQTFLSDLNSPALAVSSGLVRVTSSGFFSSYFVPEMAMFESVPRGSNRVRLVGDLSRVYAPGMVLLWTDGGTMLDFNIVEGATYNAETNRTELVLKANGRQQYSSGLLTMRRSVRPILVSPSAAMTTSRSPELLVPYALFRRLEGEVGAVLQQPDDFVIDQSGRITLTEPLKENEEVSIFYTGATIVEDGRSFRASYTHLAVPSDANGLANQVLKVDYTAYSPDSMYWRVETMASFRAELTAKYGKDAQTSIPTGGPRLENASTPKLFEQGRESVFYGEGRYSNEDIVARLTLKFLHDGITLLEDALQGMDGRIVGDHNGRFRFDGNTNNPVRATYDDITNDIDDLLKVKAGPPVVTFPPFSVSFEGTYQAAYKPSKFSRFYPTKRRLYSVAADPTGLETGETILDTGAKPFAQVGTIQRRIPWAVVTAPAKAGDSTITVDSAQGAEDLLRPGFDTATYDHQVAIQTRDGTFLVNDLAPLDVSGSTLTTLTFAAPLPVDVPVGSTIRHILMYFPNTAPTNPYLKAYRPGFDIGVTLEDGVLTHIQPFPPFDKSMPAMIPDELCIQNPEAGEVLDVFAEMSNAVTEPVRFPALDGSTRDDDNNRQFPILNPSPTSELGGFGLGALSQELSTIDVGGTLRTSTTAPFIGTGNLDGAGAVITNVAGNWPAPIPKVGDLVRITSGVNGATSFRRISAVGASTVTVVAGQEFTPDVGFAFTITVSNSLATGVTGQVATTTTLVDAIADFIGANVRVGQTVVFLTGLNAGLRRQITAVTATMLTFEAVPSAEFVDIEYRVDNPINTFGGAGSVVEEVLVPSIDAQIAVLSSNVPPEPWNQLTALEMFFDHFFTDIVTSATGAATSGLAVFTDASADFADVTVSHFIFIRNGTTAGVYKILSVDSATQVTVDGTFPATAAGISYRIVKVDFLTKKSLVDAFQVLLGAEAAEASVTAFQATLAAALVPVAVMGDTGAYANSLAVADLDARVTDINTRIGQVTDPVTGGPVVLSAIMASGDRLYDKRYVWIDARVNLAQGILPLRERSIEDRLKAKKETRKQLTKILSTRV